MQATLLLPRLPHVAAAPTLAMWKARGDRLADANAGREGALRECFEFPGQPLPVAALTRSLDADDAGQALWLRADPAWVMADAVTLRLMQCGKMDLSTGEVEQFATALKPLIGDEGFLLEAEHPQRWYLRCSREARLPKFSSPQDALGDSLASHLPEGEGARRWRNLLNEVQIVLTQHPLNIQRTRRGLPPVNSLWFWGAGVLPAWVRCGFTHVTSDDDVATALARLAGVSSIGCLADAQQIVSSPPRRHSRKRSGEGALSSHVASATRQRQESPTPNPLPRTKEPFAGEGFGGGASVLIDLARHRDAKSLDGDWLAPMDAALKQRKFDALHVLLESGERYVVKPAHRWRFWRRVQSTA